MQYRWILILVFSISSILDLHAENGQNSEKENAFGVNFSGYVKNDFFFDTRQAVSAREGQFLLWPAPRELDENGNDLNARPSLNFLAIQSRLRVAVTGPEVLGAKPSGLIEADFVGATNDLIGQFRLRHAFIKLNWERTELLTGQYWNPFFITDCYPNTVSFNTGVPVQGLARNPQVRLTHQVGGLKLVAAALMQRDFASLGPEGKSSVYLRNALLPELHARAQYAFSNILIGAGVGYKTLVPRLTSTVDGHTYQVDESVSALSALGFVRWTTSPLTMRFQIRYGENNTDMLSISGYAVNAIVNQETMERSYTPLVNTSLWGDIETNGEQWHVGLFAGMITNQGTKGAIAPELADDPEIYGLGYTIKSLYRVSPRIVYNHNNLRLAAETELTIAHFGQHYNQYWQPQFTEQVENCRILLSVYYFF